jgi:hypothetical protein
MIRFDDIDWTEEQALSRAQTIMRLLIDPTDPGFRKVGEKRLIALLRAIYEARKANVI